MAAHIGISALAESVMEAQLTYLDRAKLRLLESCIEELQRKSVPGDFLEMGVALGGSAIVLANRMDRRRHFHGYDVFAMIPPPSEADPPEVHDRYRVIAEGALGGHEGENRGTL